MDLKSTHEPGRGSSNPAPASHPTTEWRNVGAPARAGRLPPRPRAWGERRRERTARGLEPVGPARRAQPAELSQFSRSSAHDLSVVRDRKAGGAHLRRPGIGWATGTRRDAYA